MIKNIRTSSSEFLKIEVYQPAVSYTSVSNGGVGTLRYNPNNGNIEAWDGFNWTSIIGSVDIGLTTEAKELLEWARKERARQTTLEEKAKTNVTLRNALNTLHEASEAVKIIEILSESTINDGHI